MPITTISLWIFCALMIFLFLWESSRRKTRTVDPGYQKNICFPHEKEWTLYHNSFSLCSKKIRVCLAEYGIDYDSIPIDLIETGSYENISRTFLIVNPSATVPVLLHHGHPIYESHEQLKYVAAECGESECLSPFDADTLQMMHKWVYKTSLIGDDPVASPESTAGNAAAGLTIPIFVSMVARISTYKIVEGLLFHRLKKRAVFFLFMKLIGLPKALSLGPIRKIISESAEAMKMHIDDLEGQLGNSQGPWICGHQFTIADIGMMVIFERLREGDWLEQMIDHSPLLLKYWADLKQRSSYHEGCLVFEHPSSRLATNDLSKLKESGHWPNGIPR